MDVNAIKYRPGDFYTFIAVHTFKLGQLDLQINRGDEILFDGTTLIHNDEEYADRTFRGAVKSGWVILADTIDDIDEIPEQRISANIQITHPAEGGNPMAPKSYSPLSVDADEREVGFIRTASERAEMSASPRQATNGFTRGQAMQRQAAQRQVPQRQDAQRQAFQKHQVQVEPQDGVPVREMKTISGNAAKNVHITVGQDRDVLSAIQNLQVDPGKGRSQEEFLASMTEDEREEYLARKESIRDSILSEVDAKAQSRMRASTTIPKRVGKAARNVNGFRVTKVDNPDGAVAINTIQAPQQTTNIEVEGIRFQNTGMPNKAHAPQTPSVGVSETIRRKMAQAMCPDFPDNYRFELPVKKKLARIMADFEDRYDVIQAIFAAEDEEMRAALVQEFPEAFNS